jgi:hypothetical protein
MEVPMSEQESSGGPGSDGPSRDFNASFNNSGSGAIYGQIGAVYGAVNVYTENPQDPPEKRLEIAINNLEGGNPRKAEELIREVAADGHRTNQVAYYLALSILSGRSIGQLEKEHFSSLDYCYKIAENSKADDWNAGLQVISKFVNCMVLQARKNLMGEEVDRAVAAHDGLPLERREEIRRHLDQIMAGALQERLNTHLTRDIEQARFAGHRVHRAWKFFEAAPQPPRQEILPVPELGEVHQGAGAFGLVFTIAGLAVAVASTASHWPLLASVLAVIAAGGFLLALGGREWLVARALIADEDVRHGEPPRNGGRYLPAPHPEPPFQDSFGQSVTMSLHASFTAAYQAGPWNVASWQADTAGLRRSLAAYIGRRYADPGLTVRHVQWLIAWHARRAFDLWSHQRLRPVREELRVSAETRTIAALGGAGLVAGSLLGLAYALAEARRFGIPGLALLIVGGLTIYWSRIDAYLAALAIHRARRKLAGRRHAEEMTEYHRWVQVLADRPTDIEMARWLDNDKLHIKNLVVGAYNLASIAEHAVITEPCYPAWEARVVQGPPRYSRYWMTVIVLTDKGVRKASLDLDFLTGISSAPQETIDFSYTTISRVSMIRVRVALGENGHLKVLPDQPGKQAPAGPGQPGGKPSVAQSLRVSLTDGQNVDFLLENAWENSSGQETASAQAQRRLALDTSGLSAVQQALEAVASEGAEWIAQQRKLREVRLVGDSEATTTPHPRRVIPAARAVQAAGKQATQEIPVGYPWQPPPPMLPASSSYSAPPSGSASFSMLATVLGAVAALILLVPGSLFIPWHDLSQLKAPTRPAAAGSVGQGTAAPGGSAGSPTSQGTPTVAPATTAPATTPPATTQAPATPPGTLPSSGYISVSDNGKQYLDVPELTGNSNTLTLHNCTNPSFQFSCYPMDTAAADGASSGGDSQQWKITSSAVPYGQAGRQGEYLVTFASDYAVNWTDTNGGSLSGWSEYLSNLDASIENPSNDETNVGIVPIQGDLSVSTAGGGPATDIDQYWTLVPTGGKWYIYPLGDPGQCLAYVNDGGGQVPMIEACQPGSPAQLWSINASQG